MAPASSATNAKGLPDPNRNRSLLLRLRTIQSAQAQSPKLRAVYASIDSRNYARAVKLTAAPAFSGERGGGGAAGVGEVGGGGGGGGSGSGSGSGGGRVHPTLCGSWDVTRALRAHALDRSGRTEECLLLLREVLAGSSSSLSSSSSNPGEALLGSSGVVSFSQEWHELEERIEAVCGSEASLSSAATLDADDGGGGACVAAAAVSNPSKSKKGKGGKKGGGGGGGGVAASRASVSSSSLSASASASDALLDLLDVPAWKRRKEREQRQQQQQQREAATAMAEKERRRTKRHEGRSSSLGEDEEDGEAEGYLPITDETVLATLKVTLHSLRLHETCATMYRRAVDALSPLPAGSVPDAELCDLLKESYLAYLRCACDHARAVETMAVVRKNDDDGSNDDNNDGDNDDDEEEDDNDDDRDEKLAHEARLAAEAFEGAQLSAMSLARRSRSRLHVAWAAQAALLHRGACVDWMGSLLRSQRRRRRRRKSKATMGRDEAGNGGDKNNENGDGDEDGDEDGTVAKLRTKASMLPRLAESLMSRVVNADRSEGEHPPSAEDWSLYLEALERQGKVEEALEALRGVECPPHASSSLVSSKEGGEDKGGDVVASATATAMRRINDEKDVESHEGSLIQLTQRERSERMGALCLELRRYEEARGIYRKLLGEYPDQWNYWIGLLRSAMASSGGDGGGGTSMEEKSEEEKRNVGESGAIDLEGIARCDAEARKIVGDASDGGGGGDDDDVGHSRPIRGPHLFLVECAAAAIRGLPTTTPPAATCDDDDDDDDDEDAPYCDGRWRRRRRRRREEEEGCAGSSGETTAAGETDLLVGAIAKYGDVFAPLASCCFHDLRPYLKLAVGRSRGFGEEGGAVTLLLDWAKALRLQSMTSSVEGAVNGGGVGGAVSSEAKKERRKRLRAFIFSIQVTLYVYKLLLKAAGADERKQSELYAWFEQYFPPLDEMIAEWNGSLDLGSNPAEGGQKEVLPGDELILMTSQILLHQSSRLLKCSTAALHRILSAGALLESALARSPYNPHLLIAAIGVYRRLNAASRVLELYDMLGVKQIQLESCSYLVLDTLVEGGLYGEAVRLAGEVVGLHFATAKDIPDFAAKCCGHGTMSKAVEMIQWQRGRMRPSLQLLHSKVLIMDLASLVYSGDEHGDKAKEPPLGAHHGICGGDRDVERAHKMIRDSANFYAAPSIVAIFAAAAAAAPFSSSFSYSDNRDLTVNQFELLERGSRLSPARACDRAARSAHLHGLLMRAVLLVDRAKPPKKGKAVKVFEGDVLYGRCRSLLSAVASADRLFRSSGSCPSRMALWGAIVDLARVLCAVSVGVVQDVAEPLSSLGDREKKSRALLESAKAQIEKARSEPFPLGENVAMSSIAQVCSLLPEYFVPLFALLESVGKLFTLFGWGKRKRHTKAASGALAEAAIALKGLVADNINVTEKLPSTPSASSSATDAIASVRGTSADMDQCAEFSCCAYLISGEGKGTLESVAGHVLRSHCETRRRVEPFLVQMTEVLGSYDVAPN